VQSSACSYLPLISWPFCRQCGLWHRFVYGQDYLHQLAQVNTCPCFGSVITEDGECMTEFCTRLNRGQAIGASLQKIWKCHSIPISTKTRLIKALGWPVAMYGCESWTLRKNEKTRFKAFKMKGLRKILHVLWTAKKTNEWVLNNAGVKRELLDTIKARKLSYYGSHHEETKELPGERNSARNNARCTQARKTTRGLDRQHQVVDRTLCGRVTQNVRW